MAFSEMIEQLSFGKTMPHLSSCIGVFLSPDEVFMAETLMSGGRPKVSHLVRLPVPSGAAATQTKTGGTLNTDFLQNTEKLLPVLKKAVDEIRWDSKQVVVTLSHHFGILRYFSLPPMDRRFWKTAIPGEARKYIPIPFASLVHDYQVVPLGPGPDRKPRQGALFGVTHKVNLESIRALVEKLGLHLVGIELAPCSVERLWDTLSPESAPYAQVHFDGGYVRILVSEGGVPIFFREVMLGESATVMDRRKVDLAGCVDFTRKQLGSPGPAKIRLSGAIADLEKWREAFSQDLGQPVALQETDKALGLKSGQWGGYAAIGAGLRHLTPTPLILDLIGTGRISDDDRRSAVSILTAGAALAAVFVLLGSLRYWTLSSRAADLRRLKSSGGVVLSIFKGKAPEQIQAEIDRMRDQVNFFGAITARQVPLTELLQIIAESIPDPVWVTSVNYTNPLTVGGRRATRTVTLSGHAQGASRAVEQDLAFRFGDVLKKNARFGEAFPSVEPSVEGSAKEESEDPSAASSPEERERRLENRTKFDLKCSSTRGGAS